MHWHNRWLPVVDTHADSLGAVLAGERHLAATPDPPKGQADFPRLQQGGVTLQFFSCWVDPDHKPERALPRLLQFVDAFYREAAQAPDLVVVAGLAGLQALEESTGRVGGVLSVEGAEAIGEDPALLRVLWRLGVRLLSFTWNQRTRLADGAGEDPGGGGLSKAGRAMIREMNRIGMVMDVSHLSAQSFWDVMAVSAEAPIASHSNCRARCAHPRNLSDAQIRALARAGGIQGITFVTDFLGGTADADEVVRHVLHHLDVVGDDRHIGIGSDFDGVQVPVPGIEDATHWPQFLDRLARAGLSDDTVARVAGGNYWQLLKERWAAHGVT
jgi:membrane dipeptidase